MCETYRTHVAEKKKGTDTKCLSELLKGIDHSENATISEPTFENQRANLWDGFNSLGIRHKDGFCNDGDGLTSYVMKNFLIQLTIINCLSLPHNPADPPCKQLLSLRLLCSTLLRFS